MLQQSAVHWIRLGLLALLIYGLLTFVSTLTHQPDPDTDFEAYARYISTSSYLVLHLGGSIFGTMLAIFGAIALMAYLMDGSTGSLALIAMILSVAGHALILTIFGFSTFVSPAIGQAYLTGEQGAVEINNLILGAPLIITALLGGLFYTVGAILFGIAIWRADKLPGWTGVLYAPTGFLISILGLMIGASQTAGSALLIAAAGWILWSALRRSPAEVTRPTPQPRVQ